MMRFQERRKSVGVDPAVLRAPTTSRGTTLQHQGASIGAFGPSNRNPQRFISNHHPHHSSGVSDMSWVLSGSRKAGIGAARGPRGVAATAFEPRPDAYVGDGLKVQQFHNMSQLTVGSQAMNSESSCSDNIMYAGPPVYQNSSFSQHSQDSFSSARASRGSVASIGRSVGFHHEKPSIQNVAQSPVPAGPFTAVHQAHQATRPLGGTMPIFLSSNQNPSQMLLRLSKTHRQRTNKERSDLPSIEKLTSNRSRVPAFPPRARSTASVCTESTSRDHASIASRKELEILSTSGTQESGTSETTNLRHGKEDNIMKALQAELKALFSKEMKEFHSLGDRMNLLEKNLTENMKQYVGEHLEAQIDDQSSRLRAALNQSSDSNMDFIKSEIATMHSSIEDRVSQDMQVQMLALADTEMRKSVKELVSNTSTTYERRLQDQARKGEKLLQTTAQHCVDKLSSEGKQVEEGLKSQMTACKEELVASGRAALEEAGNSQVDLIRKTGTAILSQIQDSAKIALQMLNDLSAGPIRSVEEAFGIVARDKDQPCENASSTESGSTGSKRAANDDAFLSTKRHKTLSMTKRASKLMREADVAREPFVIQTELLQNNDPREELSTPARSTTSGSRSRSFAQTTPPRSLDKSHQEIQTTETPPKQDQSLQTSLSTTEPSTPNLGASDKVTPASKQVRRSTLVTPLPCGDEGPEQACFEEAEEVVPPETARARGKQGDVEESPSNFSESMSNFDEAPVGEVLIRPCPSPMSDITNVEYGAAPRKTQRGKKGLDLNRRKLFGGRQTTKPSAKSTKKTKLESHRRTKRTFSKRSSSMAIGSLSFSFESACDDSGLQF